MNSPTIKWGTVLLPFAAIKSLIKVLKAIPEDVADMGINLQQIYPWRGKGRR